MQATPHVDQRARWRNRSLFLAAAAATGVLTMPAQLVDAGLTYDLRFADGTHTQQALTGNNYTLELWARVSGTNGNATDEALTSSYITILSTQENGGAITSGGLTATTLALGFNEAGSRPGAANELNGDGIPTGALL